MSEVTIPSTPPTTAIPSVGDCGCGMDIQGVDTTPGSGDTSSPLQAGISLGQLQQLAVLFNAGNFALGQGVAETLTGTPLNDLIAANAGDDMVMGLDGNDTILGGQGNDNIFGNAGNDLLFGNEGSDTVNGGADNDIVFGGRGNDLVLGGAGADVVLGDSGNDNVSGGEGTDLLFGGQGNDYVSGDEGNDTVFGGQGNDVVEGGAGDDVVKGDMGDDSVCGGEGSDKVFGGQGNDCVDGEAGDDTLFGGQGNDTASGGTGNDVIYGDRGNDLIAGGEGADTFRFEYFAENGQSTMPVATVPTGNIFGLDTLTDFTSMQDKIYLDSKVFSALQKGTLAENLLNVTTTFVANSDGAKPAKIIYDQTSGLVYYNADVTLGDELPLMQLQPSLNISSTDFEIF